MCSFCHVLSSLPTLSQLSCFYPSFIISPAFPHAFATTTVLIHHYRTPHKRHRNPSKTPTQKTFLKTNKYFFKNYLTNQIICGRIYTVKSIGELCNGSTADSDSVCWGSNPYSPAKKSSFFGTRIFLSKPQAWHIITARSAVDIISPCGAVSHHAPACIFLRLDDIRCFASMIYNTSC